MTVNGWKSRHPGVWGKEVAWSRKRGGDLHTAGSFPRQRSFTLDPPTASEGEK